MIYNKKKTIFTIIASLIFLISPFILHAIGIKDVLVIDNISGLKHSIVIVTKDKIEYISVTDFAYMFDGYLEKKDFLTKAIFTDKNKKITFNHSSKEVLIDEKKIYLQSPTILIKKNLYIPFDFVKRKWAEELNVNVEWKEKQAILILNKKKERKIEKKITEEKKITGKEDIYGNKEIFYTNTERKKENSSYGKYRIKTIVIDPGHGGKDPGAIGPTGVKEKDITLDIAKRLKKLIETKTDIRVILTRYFDEFVTLKKRSDIANMNKADLFISIHVNASFSRIAGGFETYYLSAQASDDMARAVSVLENGVIELEKDKGEKDYDYTELILADMAQNQFIEESIELAGILQRIVFMRLRIRRLKIKSRGIKSAFFYVLKGVTMPSILIEVAFISNPKEERKIKQDYFKSITSKCICDAILEYKKRYEDSLGFTR
ncbi:MAG: N-acetylmuramoyl-L-alanine amidase [bacterium]|nr:N-acetylmuramoyl-L-alanine amidase [bacterium]